MNIKKADERPMVIHAREKPKLHVKGSPEARARTRNSFAVRSGSEAVKNVQKRNTAGDRITRRKKNPVYAAEKRKSGKEKGQEVGQNAGQGDRGHAGQPVTASYRKAETVKDTAARKISSLSAGAASVAVKTAVDEMDGGNEVRNAYMTAAILANPAADAAGAGRRLYRIKAGRTREQRIKKKQTGSRFQEQMSRESEVKHTGKVAQIKVAKNAEGERKPAVKSKVKIPAGTSAGTVPGKTGGNAADKRNKGNPVRNRMLALFVDKLKQEESQDNIGKALKDIVLLRLSVAAKYIVRYAFFSFLALFAAAALIVLPVIAVITVIYNSPFAIFFPSISSGETAQEVLSAYVSEFDDTVNEELTDCTGYDKSEIVYVGFEGVSTPDNFFDILMVYMIKHGDGDTATDMTDRAKQNLKAVFDDMCSCTVTGRTDTDTDDEGNTISVKIKVVNVELKSCYDMVSAYSFNADEQAMLAELMKPEYLVKIGYAGGSSDPGENISLEQYHAIMEAIPDGNGKGAVAFALSKVGYPYSQAYRDSGSYYDCSSLAYYAWRSVGVDISYEGSNTAANEGKFCYGRMLVDYDEMEPGDLIFYSYGRNGRFMDITHVAIYAGDGKVIEAANARLGVVYRPVRNRSSIVFIGRPG